MGIIQEKSKTKGIYKRPIIGTVFKLAAPVFLGIFFNFYIVLLI